MKNYYEELYQFMSAKPNLAGPFDKLKQIKNNPVEVIKMYNQYKGDVKDYLAQKKQHTTVGLRETKKFTIKSEDKAAFLNRLEKFGIAVDTFDIQDNKLDKTFSIEFKTPEAIKFVEKAIGKSKGIDKAKSTIKEVENPIDVIKMDVPLFIRLLEYAREDAKTDMDLHDVTEKIIAAASKGQTLTMSDYDMIMSDKIQESFNPEDYEWEEEVDPKIVNVNSEMGEYSYVDCDVLTINGEVKELTFYLDYTDLENAPADETAYSFCEAEDGGIIYRMECETEYWGADGYRIVDIDKDSLEFIER